MTQVDEFSNISSVGQALQGLLDTPEATAKMSLGRRAARAWHRLCGPVEREHTCGIYIRKPRRAGEAPILGIYVDTAPRAADFRANREVYLARLAMEGFEFSDIRFEKTRRPPKKKDVPARKAAPAPAPALPELTDEERARVRAAVASQPESIREKAYKAMSASLRRQKYESSKNDR
ncbi:MAG: hypothetical protein Q4B45_02700 [Coriobacteriia bacterium]|nr:hypothetical protein [Coriobacteriia bacterium]